MEVSSQPSRFESCPFFPSFLHLCSWALKTQTAGFFVCIRFNFFTLGAAPLFQREPQTVLGLSVPQKQGLQQREVPGPSEDTPTFLS